MSGKITIEICTNAEWLGANNLAEGTSVTEKDLAGEFVEEAWRSLENSGLFPDDEFEISLARGQRIMLHGWNLASWFGGSTAWGIGCIEKLNAAQQDALDAASEAGSAAMEKMAEEHRFDAE